MRVHRKLILLFSSDAIFLRNVLSGNPHVVVVVNVPQSIDRKSTRLNSSHTVISYAVFCLKKKKIHHPYAHRRREQWPHGDEVRATTCWPGTGLPHRRTS